jgi:hypothetical protein
MIRERIAPLCKDVSERGFGSAEICHYVERILTGLDLLARIMKRDSPSLANQHEFDLIYDGIEKNISRLKAAVSDIDARLRTSIS